MTKLNSIAPMLHSSDIQKTIDAYTGTLGFELINRHPESGTPYWCMLGRDDVRLMFSDMHDHDDDGNDIDMAPALSGVLYLYCDDVDAVHAELTAKNADVLSEPTSQPHGMREFQVRDVNGYQLLFGQPV